MIPILKALIDLLLWGAAGVLAYGFRKPALLSMGLPLSVAAYLILSAGLMGVVGWRLGLQRQAWRYVGVRDLERLGQASAIVTLLMFALGFLLQEWWPLPRSVPIMAGVLGFGLLGGVRLLARLWHERPRRRRAGALRRVLIVGAGEAGSLLAREMQRHPEAGLNPLGFLDDEPGKARRQVVGLPVFGRVSELPLVAERVQAEEVLIAVPSASGEFVRRVVDLARAAGVAYRIIPGVFELLGGNVTLQQIREVNLEDLLRRPPVELNTAEIAGYLQDRVVLVTGAGGSIGSEIVRQVVKFKPRRVLLFGRGENSIFGIQQELARDWPEIDQVGLIGDVRDEARLCEVFKAFGPHVVFHAAAHKHVPLMEQTPSEAILNNVRGTNNIVDLCLEFRVERLVNISTDKAVNPTSVMGASKRVAEMLVSGGARRASTSQALVSVRFGNVLGSRGSVVPTFMSQIRAGGPITVTHPEMVRYFMTIPEAARLVLQAGGLAENGKVYVLNMGDPVRIADLAHDVIRLSGAQNIDVVFSGIRPGEKLYEELLTSHEGTDATSHQEIFSARLQQVDELTLRRRVAALCAAANRHDTQDIKTQLAELIPENKFGRVR